MQFYFQIQLFVFGFHFICVFFFINMDTKKIRLVMEYEFYENIYGVKTKGTHDSILVCTLPI